MAESVWLCYRACIGLNLFYRACIGLKHGVSIAVLVKQSSIN